MWKILKKILNRIVCLLLMFPPADLAQSIFVFIKKPESEAMWFAFGLYA